MPWPVSETDTVYILEVISQWEREKINIMGIIISDPENFSEEVKQGNVLEFDWW